MKTTMGIIPVKYDNDEITVLGRDLHAALEVKSHYRDWIKRMIEYGFEEGVDYVKFYENNKDKVMEESRRLNLSGTCNSDELKFDVKTNHQLKLDMAKEIAMIQRNEVGRKVRKYFIEVEKQYREKLSNRNDLNLPFTDITALAIDSASQRARAFSTLRGVHEGVAVAHAFNEVEKEFGVDLSGWKKLLPPSENVPITYNPTQLAEKLTKLTGTKYTAKKINTLLAELGYQFRNDTGWVLTAFGKQFANSYPYERNGHTGFQILWNEKILQHLS